MFEWHSGGQEAIAYTNNEVNNIIGTDKYKPTYIEVLKCTYNQTDDEYFNLWDTTTLTLVIY